MDAGSIGFVGSPEAQRRVRTVILTHSHADHIASLPILLINDHQPGTDCIRVWATRETRECLRRDVFNDRIWPDLDALGTAADPFVEWREIRSEEPFEVEGLRFTAVPVDHTVPTVGFLVEGDGVSVVLGGDSAPTDLIWQRARGLEGLRGVFLEASFPNEEQDLADASGHLTPATFGGEVAKLPAGVPGVARPIKPTPHRPPVGGERHWAGRVARDGTRTPPAAGAGARGHGWRSPERILQAAAGPFRL